jgi:hypothetical protein
MKDVYTTIRKSKSLLIPRRETNFHFRRTRGSILLDSVVMTKCDDGRLKSVTHVLKILVCGFCDSSTPLEHTLTMF